MSSSCPSTNVWKVNTNNFSSPMPVIGIYVALATASCLVFMVVDIISGIHHKKRWIPCKLFSLNSLTLTLIAIATKLSTDLTTPLLGDSGQLSKVTGILFMRTCMLFFLPSLGFTSPSQNLSNMLALSILVITIVVNVCIQIFTGAIRSLPFQYLFIFLILLVLLSPLLDLWISALEINNEKLITYDRNRDNLKHGNCNMMHRLRWCYLRSYISNPQLMLCMNQYSFFVVISSLSLTGYTLPLLFVFGADLICNDATDYKWSAQFVVGSQLITILVSHTLTLYRCFMFREQIDLHISINFLMTKVESLEVMHMINNNTPSQRLVCAATKILIIVLSIRLKTTQLILQGKATVRRYLCIDHPRDTVENPIDEQQMKTEKWIEKKGEEDIDRLVDLYRKDSPNHLIQFLSENPPDDHQQSLGGGNTWTGILTDDYQISCLSAVLLVRLAFDTLPSNHLHQPLIHALDEAFPIILFIDKYVNEVNFENKRKFEYAEKMWRLWDFKSPLRRSNNGNITTPENSLQSTAIIRSQRESHFNFINKEIHFFENIVNVLKVSPDQDPYDSIKQLLVDMLHKFLVKLPIAVFRYVTEASLEESEERIKLAINFLYKLELLEDKIHWEFPSETGITSLITLPSSPSPSPDLNNSLGITQIDIDLNLQSPGATYTDTMLKSSLPKSSSF